MLEDAVLDCMANINYWTMYEDSFDRVMNRVLSKYIYDPISRVPPMERANQIREALTSRERVSGIAVPPSLSWSEEAFRELLTRLIDRIEFYESSGVPKFQDDNQLTERQLSKLNILVQPLAETSTLSDAVERFEEKVLPELDSFIGRMDAEVLIRYLLWFDTSNLLPVFFSPKVSDSTFREYLRKIAWKIEDAIRG
jgi:hypothetical protein